MEVYTMSNYPVLPAKRLTGSVQISRPTPPKSISLDSPALDVMTDLRCIYAAVIEPSVTMDSANTFMILRGVRSLLVLNQDRALGGIITATDILGEKPLRFIQERRVKHNEILVADIMTPLDQMEAIPISEVMHAKVGHVISSLRESGRQHTLVIENTPDGKPVVCGIFSLTQIEKQLGEIIPSAEVAKTFAEIEAAVIAH
jgi:CBS domain-containing protein